MVCIGNIVCKFFQCCMYRWNIYPPCNITKYTCKRKWLRTDFWCAFWRVTSNRRIIRMTYTRTAILATWAIRNIFTTNFFRWLVSSWKHNRKMEGLDGKIATELMSALSSCFCNLWTAKTFVTRTEMSRRVPWPFCFLSFFFYSCFFYSCFVSPSKIVLPPGEKYWDFLRWNEVVAHRHFVVFITPSSWVLPHQLL